MGEPTSQQDVGYVLLWGPALAFRCGPLPYFVQVAAAPDMPCPELAD